jgi:hypothetical protein
MSLHAVPRILPLSRKRRRVLVHLVAVVLALTVLIPRASTARAATTICTLTASGPTCPTYPPPDLLNLQQGGFYAATAAQQASLQKLEDQAVQTTISDHNLSADDADAVRSWGRADAEAELYILLVKAINTSAASRTADQQNAVDWVAAMEQRRTVLAALDAGLEYVRWAGLDQGQYQSLLNSNADESDLESFLSGTPENYNLMDKNGVPLTPAQAAQSTGGWCVYRSPAPYSTDYTGYSDITTCQDTGLRCITCTPPTPKYDDLAKWGEADANYALLNSNQFSESGQVIAAALGFGLAAGAGSLALAIIPAIAVGTAVGSGQAATALAPVFAFSGAITAGAAAAVVIMVIAAIVITVIDAIHVFSAEKLPGQLASLISSAETTAPDPATLESTTDGATSIFSDFIGATLPVPVNQTCDNSGLPAGLTVRGGTVIVEHLDHCLNPTAIPPAGPTDPWFLVQAKGATTQTATTTITWKDTAAGTTTTARLSENWFIENESSQTLRIAYTDWDGKEQNAWLVKNKTGGTSFLGFSVPADTSTPVDPTTCVANGICSNSTFIHYVGSDGKDYSASVHGYTPPTGSPTYSSAVEASPITFQANHFAPGSAIAPITYTWQFQKAGCGIPCQTFGASPLYTTSVSGSTATYTWQTSGKYLVSLTATDGHGVKANDTFTVAVGDLPPTLQVSPTCGSITIVCTPQTADVGTSMGLAGTVRHTGSLDNEKVTVNWGDGSGEDVAGAGPNSLGLAGNSLSVTPSADGLSYTLSDTHTYTAPGTYTVTVWVYDWDGGTDSKTFTESILPTGAPLLVRYYEPGVSHWVTTGTVGAIYKKEQTLGYVYAQPAGSFTTALYGCLQGTSDYFLSHDPGCEGQTALRTEGYVSNAAQPDRVAIYRCYTGSDHFASTDPKCEGTTMESMLGYVVATSTPGTAQTQSAGTTASVGRIK